MRLVKLLSVAPLMAALIGCGSSALNAAQMNVASQSVMPQRLHWLPFDVRETSALAILGDTWWTLNDSGDRARLYGINPETGKLKRKLRIKGAGSEDWESLAADDTHLYIADTGNNRGDRPVLQVYKVALVDMKEALVEVNAEPLSFRYADYVDQTQGRAKHHNVDCEAMVVVDGELWLFTKNRGDHQSRLYKLDPNNPAEQKLEPIMTLPVGGLITGAAYDADSGELALLGYGAGLSFGNGFIWRMPVKSGQPDWEQAKLYTLAEAGQWEAIQWLEPGSVVLTAERSVYGAQRMSTLTLP